MRGVTAQRSQRDELYPIEAGRIPEPRSTRGRKRSLQSHDAIVESTLALLQEVGYQRLTIESVAAHAGVGKATIYRWWSTKANLAIEAIGHRLRQPPPLTGDTETDVRAMIRTLVDIFNGPVGHVLPALALDLADAPQILGQLASLLGPYRASNAATLLSAAEHGDLPYNIDTTAILDTIVGALIYRRMMRRPLDDMFATQLTQLIVSGRLPMV